MNLSGRVGGLASGSEVTREPIGIVAALTSGTFPVALIARRVPTDLVAGPSVIFRPSGHRWRSGPPGMGVPRYAPFRDGTRRRLGGIPGCLAPESAQVVLSRAGSGSSARRRGSPSTMPGTSRSRPWAPIIAAGLVIRAQPLPAATLESDGHRPGRLTLSGIGSVWANSSIGSRGKDTLSSIRL